MNDTTVPRPLTLGVILYPGFELLDVFGPLEMFASLGRERLVPVMIGGIGTLPELANEKLMAFLRERSPRAQITASVCTGSALLARSGVLDGHRATSNKQVFSLATAQSSAVEWIEAARWVDDGAIVTSSGVSAGMDMALAIIARLFGDEAAEAIAIGTEYTWHRDATVDPFVAYLNQMAGMLAPAKT